AGAEGCLSSSTLEGLRSECSTVWFDRVAYESAESLYYVRLLQQQNGTTAPASSSARNKQETCRHGEQEACHHVVNAVWVNKPNFDQAESKFVGRVPNQPRSLQLQPASCDEGYQSQTPTPPTPASRPINGLPSLPPPPMGVWLQKPLFDKAEATFYQNLYGQNSPPRNPETSGDESNSKRRNNAQKKPVICNGRETDNISTNQGAARCYFLHADSERVWLDRGRYAEAETCFCEEAAARSVKTSINHSSQKQKYDSILEKIHFSHTLMTAAECLAQERIWFDKPRYDEAERQFYERMNGPTQPKQDTGANSILQDIARARENIQKSLAGLKTTLQPSRGSAPKISNPSHRSSPVSVCWDDETEMAKLEECVRSVQVDGLLWGASKLVPVGYGIKKLQINCVVEDDKVGTDFLEEEITKFEDYVQSVD
ncbi:uncharacterized protein, partial [Sinocyclocheilus grahami]|uniref:uncharacterized protein n=1 Tax=Sinocyclocheilus grahami TaxID=75366 RepID=UPI0007AC640D